MIKDFYIPEGITDDYIYIVPSNNYYDLYNTTTLQSGNTYTFYRFYNYLEKDLYQEITETTTIDTTLNTIEINPKNNYIYREDYLQIISISAFLILFIVILINLFTSIIRKGGVLSGLL